MSEKTREFPRTLSDEQLRTVDLWARDSKHDIWGNDEARRFNLATFARAILDSGAELGDGEPSPLKKALEKIAGGCHCDCDHSNDDCCERSGEFCPHCIAELAIRGESGAAQEVSPSASEIRSDDPPPSCHVCGAIFKRDHKKHCSFAGQSAPCKCPWKCSSCGANTECSDGGVSPPSPEPWKSLRVIDGQKYVLLSEVGEATIKRIAATLKAEGDTRGLKAALRWIPVEEKLPPIGERVIVSIHGIGDGIGHKTRTTGLWNGEGWLRGSLERHAADESWPIKGEVTHWQKLPAPPLSKGNEK